MTIPSEILPFRPRGRSNRWQRQRPTPFWSGTCRAGRRRGVAAAHRAVRGAAAGLRRQPAARPGRQRGRGAGDLHRLPDQPAALRREAGHRGVPVLDRGAQADGPPAEAGPAADRPVRLRRPRPPAGGGARRRPGRLEHRAERRAAQGRGAAADRIPRPARPRMAGARRLRPAPLHGAPDRQGLGEQGRRQVPGASPSRPWPATSSRRSPGSRRWPDAPGCPSTSWAEADRP